MAADARHALEQQPKAKIFISYSRKDMAFADRLEGVLKARGFEPLIDREEIYAFEDWWRRIQVLIGRADTIVFVLSPDAVTSDVALKEVEHGAFLNKRFAPIVARRVEDQAVPEALRRLNFIFFDDPDRFEASADQLSEALITDIDWIRKHTEFGELARRWSVAGRRKGLLLRSPLLDEAEHWMNSRPLKAPAPTDETRAFIIDSRRDASSRKLRAWMSAVGLGGAAVAAALAWSYQERIGEYSYWYSHVRGHVLTFAQEAALRRGDSFKECTVCPIMIVVPAGTFVMGSPVGVGDPYEHPQHMVTLARAFAVGKFAVTFDEWDACAERGACSAVKDDRGWGRGSRPVINVSWDDAQSYVAWLTQITRKTYRLLTEAEFEYAARAGTATNYPWGDDVGKNNANCEGCGSEWDAKKTAPVGSFKPNAFALFDMNGNVGQWVEDCFQLDYTLAPADGSPNTAGACNSRVFRGGSAFDTVDAIRSAHRAGNKRTFRVEADGFRVARTIGPLKP